METTVHPRLARMPRRVVLGVEVAVAADLPARLLGLAGIPARQAGSGLLIPRCASVHTLGMRFPLDLFFLDPGEEPLMVCRAMPPRRLAWCRGAVAVLEVPSASGSSFQGGEFPAARA
jgi:uncharacterized membrane protein (UPF0127 family)